MDQQTPCGRVARHLAATAFAENWIPGTSPGMTKMTQETDITAIERSLIAEIAAAGDLAAIERVRIAALGKKGRVPELMARLGALPAEQRKAFGQAVNGLKARVGEALEGRKAELERGALSARLATEKADAHGQRDVGLLGCQARGERPTLEPGLAPLQRLADAGLQAVDRLPERLALIGGKSSEPAHELGDLPLPAEGRDAHALDGAQVPRRADLGDQRALDGGDIDCFCHPLSSRACARDQFSANAVAAR